MHRRQHKLDLYGAGVDVPGVNTKPLGRIFSAFFIYLALLGCAAVAKTPPVVPMGDNTYSITREASNGFKRDVDQLKAEASEDAAAYCAAQGKQLKVVSLTSDKPWIGFGYAKAKIVFKALSAGEAEVAAAPMAGASVAVEPREKPVSMDDLVSDLTKLDDLRKKGILTDEEFQTEKKKILSRTK